MPLDPSYLEYPKRGYGMDHDRYDWTPMVKRPPLDWHQGGAPSGTKLALVVVVGLQFFPLNSVGKPFRAPGALSTAYPDLRHYTLRDYGNRVGIFRMLKAFDRYGIKPSMAIDADTARRLPALVDRIRTRGDEMLCNGLNQDVVHHSGMEHEGTVIAEALDTVRKATGQDVTGWISPAKAQSHETPDLLAANGVTTMLDWVNDDLPFEFRTANGALTALPLSTELADWMILLNNLHSEQSYTDQLCDAFDLLYAEAENTGSGRMLALHMHPWLLGQPHRIGKLEAALDHITGHEGVWSAPVSAVVEAWKNGESSAS